MTRECTVLCACVAEKEEELKEKVDGRNRKVLRLIISPAVSISSKLSLASPGI